MITNSEGFNFPKGCLDKGAVTFQLLVSKTLGDSNVKIVRVGLGKFHEQHRLEAFQRTSSLLGGTRSKSRGCFNVHGVGESGRNAGISVPLEAGEDRLDRITPGFQRNPLNVEFALKRPKFLHFAGILQLK